MVVAVLIYLLNGLLKSLSSTPNPWQNATHCCNKSFTDIFWNVQWSQSHDTCCLPLTLPPLLPRQRIDHTAAHLFPLPSHTFGRKTLPNTHPCFQLGICWYCDGGPVLLLVGANGCQWVPMGANGCHCKWGWRPSSAIWQYSAALHVKTSGV